VLMDGLCIRHAKQSCSICLEPVGSMNTVKSKRLSCGHAFHVTCIMEWFIESECCPACREKQEEDPIIVFKTKVEDALRLKFKDAIDTLEEENRQLKETLRMQTMFNVAANRDPDDVIIVETLLRVLNSSSPQQ